MLGGQTEFKGRKLSLLPKARTRSLGDALARRGLMAALIAEQQGAELLVLVTDLDRGSGRKDRPARAIEQKQVPIARGCGEAEAEVAHVIGIACRTIEAWALGDLAAVGSIGAGRAALPPGKNPEQLWGKPRDPGSNHPKFVLARALDRRATSDDLRRIAEQADLEQVAMSCPLSFRPFWEELEGAIGAHPAGRDVRPPAP